MNIDIMAHAKQLDVQHKHIGSAAQAIAWVGLGLRDATDGAKQLLKELSYGGEGGNEVASLIPLRVLANAADTNRFGSVMSCALRQGRIIGSSTFAMALQYAMDEASYMATVMVPTVVLNRYGHWQMFYLRTTSGRLILDSLTMSPDEQVDLSRFPADARMAFAHW